MSLTNQDLFAVTRLPAVIRKAHGILEAVADGVHPIKLGGIVLGSTENTLISVPVGLRFRLIFSARTLDSTHFMTHEQYNKFIRSRR